MHVFLFLWVLLSGKGIPRQNQNVVQINISSLLNARPVTTLTINKLRPWTKGIDGGGAGDGYLTQSAALFHGDTAAHALPDTPIAEANSHHPQILLHYNNRDGKHNQARAVAGADTFLISVPANQYSALFLGLSSAEGPSHLQCELNYRNGQETKNYILPDYYTNVAASDSLFSYVFTNLAKWDRRNHIRETDHHNIHLLKILTNPNRLLTSITVKKGKEGYLVFWSATGVRR